jgi:hypothetical protein
MPRAQWFHLAQTLATVAPGAATLAIAYPGQLPATRKARRERAG